MPDQPRSVWLLASGDYSDYSIHGVYSTKDLAERVKAEHDKRGHYNYMHDPEEWELDRDIEDVFGPVWPVTIYLESGDVERILLDTYDGRPCVRHPDRCDIQDWTKAQPGPMFRVVSPIGYEHAEKVAIEKRQEWLRTRDQQHATNP